MSFWFRITFLALIILGVAGAAKFVMHTFHENRALTAELAIKKIEIEAKQKEINTLKMNLALSERRSNALQVNIRDAEVSAIQSKKVLNSHDFGKLLEQKPGLVTDRMRNGTKRVFLDIEKEANR